MHVFKHHWNPEVLYVVCNCILFIGIYCIKIVDKESGARFCASGVLLKRRNNERFSCAISLNVSQHE
jgi:hypothetical protein